ncbi:hypothetical protein BH23PLA1_BH23PLA1_05130 [soil metagenome]
MRHSPARPALILSALFAGAAIAGVGLRADSKDRPDPSSKADAPAADVHRSPIALALSADGSKLLSANQTAGSVSLIDTADGLVFAEIKTGEKPAGVALSADGKLGVVTHWYGYDLAILKVGADSLEVVGRVEVVPEPRGVVLGADGQTAYVAVGVRNEVVRVDLDAEEVTGRVEVGREPRGIALSPDGSKLLVGNSRASNLSVIDVEAFEVERTLPIQGVNLRQVAIDPDGQTGYVANMQNRGMATTQRNIDLGWVLGQRLTKVALDASEDFSTLSLDPQGHAVSDAHGMAVSPDGKYLAVSCGGTAEVLLFRTDMDRLPWRYGGARDLIHYELLSDDGRFRRVETGGRPTELAFAPDGKTLYVANYLEDFVQVIDAEAGEVVRAINLGGPVELSLARRGEVLFHDATRSVNQWYSCNTCHSDGHTNGDLFDTRNDGWQDLSSLPKYSKKAVPTLRGVTRTGPWTWHGWQESIEDAMIESFTVSMQGQRPTDEEVRAIVVYLDTLEHPPNPYLEPDGRLSEAAERGREVFRSPKAACNTCHSGPEFTDGRIHIVGTEDRRRDVYEG